MAAEGVGKHHVAAIGRIAAGNSPGMVGADRDDRLDLLVLGVLTT